MSIYGIQTSAWLRIESDCPIKVEVCSGEAELTLGGRYHDVQILVGEAGLAHLVERASGALTELRASQQERSDADGIVTDG